MIPQPLWCFSSYSDDGDKIRECDSGNEQQHSDATTERQPAAIVKDSQVNNRNDTGDSAEPYKCHLDIEMLEFILDSFICLFPEPTGHCNPYKYDHQDSPSLITDVTPLDDTQACVISDMDESRLFRRGRFYRRGVQYDYFKVIECTNCTCNDSAASSSRGLRRGIKYWPS